MRSKPLRGDAHATHKQKTHAVPETKPLREEEMPDLRREGRADEGNRLQHHANEQRRARPEVARRGCGDRGHHERLADGQAADESVGEMRGSGEDVVGEVVGEEDGVGGVEAPRMTGHGQFAIRKRRRWRCREQTYALMVAHAATHTQP